MLPPHAWGAQFIKVEKRKSVFRGAECTAWYMSSLILPLVKLYLHMLHIHYTGGVKVVVE